MPGDAVQRLAPPAPFDGRVRLAEPDAAWAAHFADEARRIRAALGDRAVVVEHVGSTSVPGLVAKPIIDIALGVPDAADEPAYRPALEAAGYVLRLREPAWYEHRLFGVGAHDVNLHVFSAGCPEIERMTMFRDHLRGHAADRERYAAAKRALAERSWRELQDYADAKDAIVDEILRATGAPPRVRTS